MRNTYKAYARGYKPGLKALALIHEYERSVTGSKEHAELSVKVFNALLDVLYSYIRGDKVPYDAILVMADHSGFVYRLKNDAIFNALLDEAAITYTNATNAAVLYRLVNEGKIKGEMSEEKRNEKVASTTAKAEKQVQDALCLFMGF